MSPDPHSPALDAQRATEHTVAVLDPRSVPLEAGPAQLVWAAPGSLGTDDVLAAYRRGGLRALGRVTGPWGVVIWDPGRRSHVIATDPIGVQPVHWARTSAGTIAVSSSIAALADRPDVSEELDLEGILISEARGCTGDAGLERTRFVAIHNVPMGRAVEVHADGSLTRYRYYDPASVQVDDSLTLAESSELLAERIDAAVRRALPGGETYGAHVSGGLDCTTVACRAHQVLRERGEGLVAGYSWAPTEDEVPRFAGDERDLLDAVTAQEGFPIRRNATGPHGRWWLERDPNRYPQSTHAKERFVLPVAQEDGIDVMLSGWGGDELASFNGRVVADHLFRTGQWRALWRDGAYNVRRPDRGRWDQARGAVRRVAGTAFWQLPDPITGLRHPRDSWPERTLSREIDREIRSMSALAADLRRDRFRRFSRTTDPHEFQLALLTGGHIQHRTGGWYQTGELFGIRYRYPLLDLGVVEAALSLPWQAFRSQGWTRVAYRRAAAAWVPGEVAWNLHKVEPALFFPPTEPKKREPDPDLPPLQPFQPPNPQYGRAMQIVGQSYRRASDRGRVDPGSRVRARTDAAV